MRRVKTLAVGGVHYVPSTGSKLEREVPMFATGRKAALHCLAWTVIALTPVRAQIGGTGTVQGVVSDPSGAVVPGATVTATSEATGTKTVRQTTGTGYYVISPLPAGQYSVTVTASGFQT